MQTDRLGSVRYGGPGGLGKQAQYPYGVEYATTANDREKYATYTRDSVTGLAYGINRYYASRLGAVFVAGSPTTVALMQMFRRVGTDIRTGPKTRQTLSILLG